MNEQLVLSSTVLSNLENVESCKLVPYQKWHSKNLHQTAATGTEKGLETAQQFVWKV